MKTALVTGANRGIGLEFCKQLSREDGYRVLAVCRTESKELQALAAEGGIEIFSRIDVALPDSIAQLSRRCENETLHLLVNNAGILREDSLDSLTWDGIEAQLKVNSIGPLRVTSALLDRMPPGSKIAMVTSRMGSMKDNTSGGYYGYRMSKAALNAASVSLAIDLRPREIAVAILHPGYVKTDMTGYSGNIEPQDAVQGMRKNIHRLTMANSGTFWHTNGEELPW